jgi:hypothetical protein
MECDLPISDCAPKRVTALGSIMDYLKQKVWEIHFLPSDCGHGNINSEMYPLEHLFPCEGLLSSLSVRLDSSKEV